MYYSTTVIATPEGSSYIRKLCRHFVHKIPATYSETEGVADFPYGKAIMLANATSLQFRISAGSSEALEKVKRVLVEHLLKFAFREELQIGWTDEPGAAS